MTVLTSTEAISALWADWHREEDVATDPMSALRRMLARGGTRLSLRDLAFALAPVGPLGKVSFERLADGLIPLLAGPELRLERAFGYLAPRGARMPVDDLRRVLGHFVADPAQLDAMLEEIDEDGDRNVTLADFRAYYPHHETLHPLAFRSSHVPAHHVGAHAPLTPDHGGDPPAAEPDGAADTGAAPAGRYSTTSPLQMQIGFFRLLQGAAYRSFRASYAANAETHLKVRDLPYTITDFAEFVDAAVEFYLALGIVDGPEAQAEFRRLGSLVAAEVASLRTRIETWEHLPKTPQMRAAEACIEEDRAAEGAHRARFAECIEFILALRLHGVAPAEVGLHSLSEFEINRLSHLDLASEHGPAPAAGAKSADLAETDQLDRWNPVNMADGARPEGAIVPVRFWYERFMPQLLRCASIMNAADLAVQSAPDEAALDRWHADQIAAGAFQPYAGDVEAGFERCTPRIKLAIRQAWRLTEHYLNGLEKRREREEFGRGSGYLSQYVAFIDAWLGRHDVEQSEMRLSFPYYIGPAVWCFLHSSAELVEALDGPQKAEAILRFKRFFRAFATMYPCPYCRHHLNRYVLRNSEVDRYPVEFLFLGQHPDNPPLQITPEDRLAGIAADRPGSLRLFVWKLHNAVSSSIQRTEAWYHPDDRPLYTTRFWPGLDAELSHARALGRAAVPVDKIDGILGIVKPCARLAAMRATLQSAWRAGDPQAMAQFAQAAQAEIADLERAVERSGYLPRSYGYDPDKADAPPHFTAQEEAFARSGRFIER